MKTNTLIEKTKTLYQKSFTLIELIVVIVVIGILTAIVVPNVSSMKQEAEIAAVQSNAKNLQTAIDMYMLENHGLTPTEGIPEFGAAAPLNFNLLHPDFVRSLPETKGYNYWVDDSSVIWQSKADSPTGVNLPAGSTELTWNEVEDADAYGVYQVESSTTSAAKSNKRLTLIKKVDTFPVTVTAGKTYAVSSFDKNGMETPPATVLYKGYPTNADYLLPGAGTTGDADNPEAGTPGSGDTSGDTTGTGSGSPTDDSTTPGSGAIVYEDNQPKIAGPVTWKTNTSPYTWEGDLTRRVVIMDVENPYVNGGSISIKDAAGNPLTFYDTDNKIMTSARFYERTQIALVIPAGAASIHVTETSTRKAVVHSIKVVDDNVLPDPVTNLSLTPSILSVELKWTNPVDADFKNAVVFRNGELAGVSTNGTFVDKPLHSGRAYKYEVESQDASGNRSRRTIGTVNTLPRFIDWAGLTPEGFDFDSTTTAIHPYNKPITWTGDLAGRVVTIDMENPMVNGVTFTVLDAAGKTLAFTDAENAVQLTSYRQYNRGTKKIIVPDGAASFMLSETSGYSAKIYDIHEDPLDNIPAAPVSNLVVTPGDVYADLSWTPPSEDYVKAAIYRNGNFIAFANGSTYRDLPLYTGSTHTYDVRSVDAVGNLSSKVSKTTTLIKRDIVWYGMDAGAFDGNSSTSAIHPYRTSITWDGDLIGRTLLVDFENKSVNGALFYFRDASGVSIPFMNANTGATVTFVKSYARTAHKVIVPEGAVSILISESSTAAKVYDLIELD